MCAWDDGEYPPCISREEGKTKVFPGIDARCRRSRGKSLECSSALAGRVLLRWCVQWVRNICSVKITFTLPSVTFEVVRRCFVVSARRILMQRSMCSSSLYMFPMCCRWGEKQQLRVLAGAYVAGQDPSGDDVLTWQLDSRGLSR